jgi:hypothetical protein
MDKKPPDEVVFGRRVDDNTGVCTGVCVHFPTRFGGLFVADISSTAACACASAKADAMAFFGLSPTESKFANSISYVSSKIACSVEGVSDISEKVTFRFGRLGTGLVIGKIPGGVNSG